MILKMLEKLVPLLVIAALFHNKSTNGQRRKEIYDDLISQGYEILGKDNPLKEPELYWKPYLEGQVPGNAVLAGTRNRNGKKIDVFIGHVEIDVTGAEVQPVAIYGDSIFVTNTYGRTIYTKENVRILCSNATNTSEVISWIAVEEAGKFKAEEDFVVTGNEVNNILTMSSINIYTGRGTFDGDFYVGKVVKSGSAYKFYYADSWLERFTTEGFEILIYSRALLKVQKSL